ncbi:hypothetical protein D0Z08_09385 [Nocardioides immobilis]|uniref:Uncharacterized protein n=1 Tax=Nocardioides immobilis TaxID=2049295 RepID=A0A417Y450_9ACTN|nr:hypothetical protein [Nocardioides immobilis]RHW27356.1 hypothetical protein D0Z08_09385 [Nocardioides immobilis]
MDDQLDPAAGDGPGDLPGLGVDDLEVEGEGEILAGDLPESDRPAHVQRLLTAELAEQLRPAGDRGFEVQGIGDVEGGGDLDGAVEPSLVEVDVDVPRLLGRRALLLGRLRVVADQGLLDQPVDLRPGNHMGDGRELPVHEPSGIGGQGAGGLGEPECLPHRHPALQHPGPGPGEPVGQLDDLPHIGAAGVQRPTDEGGELHHREVADQRGAGSGDREPGVQTALGDRRSVPFFGHHMLARPLGDPTDLGDLVLGDRGLVVTDLGQ